jgi:hypothetical protein
MQREMETRSTMLFSPSKASLRAHQILGITFVCGAIMGVSEPINPHLPETFCDRYDHRRVLEKLFDSDER